LKRYCLSAGTDVAVNIGYRQSYSIGSGIIAGKGIRRNTNRGYAAIVMAAIANLAGGNRSIAR